MTAESKRREPPVFKDYSRSVFVEAVVKDWWAGEFTLKTIRVEVRSVKMRNRKTGRYRRIWEARREDSLGWHLGATPAKALREATIQRTGRPAWLAPAVERAYSVLKA